MLADITVLGLGQGIPARFCGLLLARSGARVTTIEAPWLSSAISSPSHALAAVPGLADYLSAGQNTLRPGAAEREQLPALAASAAIVIVDQQPSELEAWGLAGLLPAVAANDGILVTISPCGWLCRDPAHQRASDATLFHGGGLGYLTPRNPPSIALPPLKPATHLPEFLVGLVAALGAMSALLKRDTDGSGNHVDVSGTQAMAFYTGMLLALPSYLGTVASRANRSALGPYGAYRCRDGYVMIVCSNDAHWASLVDLMGRPEWAAAPEFRDGAGRSANADVLNYYIEEWLQAQDAEAVERDAQARRIPVSRVATVPDVLLSPHLADRDFWQIVSPGLVGPGLPFTVTRS